ncbi:MAG TPA: prepilin-type N-terminal cleavage/methylation domain-containing protein [Pontiellaceae bacterium]|nr:prepilin-type N-terminal cleavage/methylation domain-containing protein [Pontiellaceae bacterium]HPR82657.1 prepilin-type N-terminal cleavage/methylation domain-containing protein [Pontiellaceae bacterium]
MRCFSIVHRSAARRGFTLIELLVALALLGILGASLAGVLRNSMDSVEQAQSSVDHLTRLRSLDTMLGAALRDATALALSTNEQKLLSAQGSFDAAAGTIRFHGEERLLGFCLQRPFFSAERDGHMHWVTLEVRQDEKTGRSSLWLQDISFIPGLDNPVGADWGGLEAEVKERLPVQEVCLIREAAALSFKYWLAPADASSDAEEVEADSIAGDYALAVPDYIELSIQLPKGAPDVLTFDYSFSRRVL